MPANQISDLASRLGLGQEIPSNKRDEVSQEEFLALMVAQLENQDPMKPQENGEFISQMAQFSTVDGIGQLNESFSSLVNSLQSNQALQASALVGRKIDVESNLGHLAENDKLEGKVPLDTSVTELKVNIYDASGQLVKAMDLGTHPAGQTAFSWDGIQTDGTKAKPGLYRIEVMGKRDGNTLSLNPIIEANVDSVTLPTEGQDIQLNLANGITVSLSSVKSIN